MLYIAMENTKLPKKEEIIDLIEGMGEAIHDIHIVMHLWGGKVVQLVSCQSRQNWIVPIKACQTLDTMGRLQKQWLS